MKFSVYGESWASRIRQFWDDLFTSRHVRFLEAELARVRAEKDAEIQRLSVAPLEQRFVQPQDSPIITAARNLAEATRTLQFPSLGNYEAELQAHNKALEEEEAKEKKDERK